MTKAVIVTVFFIAYAWAMHRERPFREIPDELRYHWIRITWKLWRK